MFLGLEEQYWTAQYLVMRPALVISLKIHAHEQEQNFLVTLDKWLILLTAVDDNASPHYHYYHQCPASKSYTHTDTDAFLHDHLFACYK